MTYAMGDDGFSIVELLVAIAITSFVVLAIGGLLTLGLRVKERVDENGAVQSALIDLQGLAALAASEVGFVANTIGERSFTLVKESAARSPVAWSVALHSAVDGADIELKRERRTSAVSLTAFDTTELEYLALVAGRYSWNTAKGGIRSALGIRLKLQQDNRVWRPLIWIASSRNEVAR